ncbi:SH3 domain-containing RING finger protein 3-like [Tropilaelaps mercedesae]|uniref:RING-type E3 ubiquitin transferase n=1 Tax=Tropilaelaps mercedesae TaxID=418985 RepID=A0A1V9X7Z3_9ACAR|nr:SH3 domain-containing RING finger protein 3-like [Tropilaelaps mercedesae]
MDAAFLNELLECSVCLEQLDSSSRVLPCQHTFCKRCLQEIVQSKGELRCPECRTLVETKVDELPVNIFLVRLLEGIKNKTPRKCQSAGQAAFAEQFLLGTGLCQGGPSSHPLGGPQAFYAQPAHSAICCAKAIYPYESSNVSDLSFQKGDLINLIKRIDVNWYQGELKGKVGYVPASYITVVTLGPLATALSSQGGPLGHSGQAMGQALAKALYDFQITDKSSEEKECLTFSRGEIIAVLRRVDENWAEGRVGDRQGIFPISFVEMNVAAKQLIKMITCSGPSRVAPAPPPPLSSSLSDQGGGAKTPSQTPDGLVTDFSMATENKRHSLSALNLTTALGTSLAAPASSSTPANAEHRHSMEILSDRELQSPQTPLAAPLVPAGPKLCPAPGSGPAAVTHSAPPPPLGQNKLLEINATVRRHPRPKDELGAPPTSLFYVALYNYKPQKDDELELKKGEVYMVSEKCQDGWFKGSALKSGAQGVFPGNYVQHTSKGGQQQQQQGLQATPTFYASTGPQTANPGLVQGFSNLCVSSPMRPRSNPQLPLNALYGGTQRSSEWPLSTNTAFSGQFGDVIVGGSALPNAALMLGGGGGGAGSSGGMLKCGQVQGGIQQGQYRSVVAPLKQGWTAADHGSSPPLPSGQTQQPSQATVIAQHLSLVKRLTRHKSKSPPPALGLGLVGGVSLDDSPPVHIRSGSCPSSHSSHSSPAGPSGGSAPTPGPLHKKTASLDDALASPSQSPLTPLTPVGVAGVTAPSQSGPTLTSGVGQTPAAAEPYRCIVPYPANSDYELELKVGDVVYVHKKRDDGWCKGTLQRTGQTGLFPASFVKQTTTTTEPPAYAAADYGLAQGHAPGVGAVGQLGGGGGLANLNSLPPAPAMFQCGPASAAMSYAPPTTHILNPPQ